MNKLKAFTPSTPLRVFRPSTKLSAFTIVELLVVIVVIGILASITILSYNGITNKAIASSLQSDLANASKQLDLFQVDYNYYPSTIDCTIPDSTTNKCIKTNLDATSKYIINNSINPSGFCLALNRNGVDYMIDETKQIKNSNCDDYNLVLHLDAGNPLSYPGSGTVWSDVSGFNRIGTLVNGVTYSTDGGGSLNFDGADDHIYINNSSSLYFQQYTYLAWVNVSNFGSGSDYTTIFSKWYTSAGRQIHVNLQINSSGKLKASVAKSTNDINAVGIIGNTSLFTNSWYLVGCTFSNQILKVWLNGASDGLINTGYDAIADGGTNNLFIGKYDFTWTAYRDELMGKISDIYIYKRELTSSELMQKFNNTKGRYGL